MILVALVVLLFLQNWRSAIIPLVAVPVAIIGTFAVMAAMGFSLNNLTLFGLVLAIGIVVDDAIVVVEAVEHHIEHGLRPREATHQGHEPGLRAGDRRGPGAQRGVRALRVHQRHHGAVLPAVRPDHRRLDADLGLQLADAQPGPVGLAAAAARPRSGSARGVAAAGCSRCLGGWLGFHALAPGLGRGLDSLLAAAPAPSARGLHWTMAVSAWPWGGGLGAWPGPELRPGLGLPAIQRRLQLLHRASIPESWAGLLRLSVVVLVVYGGLLYVTYWGFTQSPPASSPCRTRATCW